MPDREETEAIEARIAELKLEHRDLDDVINRLLQSPVQDQLQLQRLKKRKLLVKDQITLLERQLTPDIRA
ncbi:MAG: YdcH family protein [Burkholderiales bacterium]